MCKNSNMSSPICIKYLYQNTVWFWDDNEYVVIIFNSFVFDCLKLNNVNHKYND